MKKTHHVKKHCIAHSVHHAKYQVTIHHTQYDAMSKVKYAHAFLIVAAWFEMISHCSNQMGDWLPH